MVTVTVVVVMMAIVMVVSVVVFLVVVVVIFIEGVKKKASYQVSRVKHQRSRGSEQTKKK